MTQSTQQTESSQQGMAQPADSSRAGSEARSSDPVLHLIELLDSIVQPLGYELVHAEAQTHRQKLLRLFIDSNTPDQGVTIDDCVKVTRAVDEPLDQDPALSELVGKIFGSASYELEVSSPGVDRPLRKAKDYLRFAGREARLHVFRPLSAEELANPEYHARNPKQKNFLGTLLGLENQSVRLQVNPTGGMDSDKKNKKSKRKKDAGSSPESCQANLKISIPLSLVSKANLEPQFDFED
ncbi:MAG: ribosome maturation factor RimP [Oligoflexia bacterium]|nr:ribosome maturation factor RimP [Oligoflexia bacterium]